jgi:phosphatidylglycerophosphate synthase
MDRARLDRIRNTQNRELYPALVMRPLAVAVMLVVADWRWLTPNLLTVLATACKLAAAWLIWRQQHMVIAVITLQLGVLFDHLDGTMARYRRTPSHLGFFFDTTSDAVTWFVLLAAIGWTAFTRTGAPLMLGLAAIAAYALMLAGYLRAVVEGASERSKWFVARRDPAAAVLRETRREPSPPPPRRSAHDWLVWIGQALLASLHFAEMDLFLWIGVFLLLDRPDLLLWGLAATQTGVAGVMIVLRARQMRAFDRLEH